MKRLSDWWKARCEQAKANAAADEADRQERSKTARDAITAKFKEALDGALESGWKRAVEGVHFPADYTACGCYLFGPDGRLYVMTVHSQGAIHFKRI